jgi:hypothetical protein
MHPMAIPDMRRKKAILRLERSPARNPKAAPVFLR